MSDNSFVVKNGLVVNSTFTANSTQFGFSSINSTSNGFFANSTAIQIGNSSINSTINSTAFNGITNNALYLGGISATNYLQSTAQAVDSAKLGGVVAAAYINSTGSYTITGVHTYNANLVLSTITGISANNTYGTNGQYLTTNSSAVYWSSPKLSANSSGGTGAVQYYNGSILGSSAGINVNDSTNTMFFGNTSVSATVNSTAYTGSANNAAYLGGLSYTGYINSTSLTTTLGNYVNTSSLASTLTNYVTTTSQAADSAKLGGILAANYVNTGGNFVLGGTIGFSNSVSVNGAFAVANSISANGAGITGTAGQVLTSGGAGQNVYWTAAVNTANSWNWSNTQTFTNQVTFNGAIVSTNSVSANGSTGTAGQVLISGGAGQNVYWSAAAGANNNGGTGSIQFYNGINFGSVTGLSFSASSNTLSVSNTINIGSATINSTSYSGNASNANNATYLGGYLFTSYVNSTSISNYVQKSDTFYIGTTSISHTRNSGSQTLTGTNIDGNANSATNFSGTLSLSQVTTALGFTPGIGTVTSVTATAPITSSGGATPVIAISAASASANGYLLATDWSTFNNKQAALPAATSTVSGYLTSTDWSTFNNKQAALGFTPAPIASPTFTGTVTIPSGASISGYAPLASPTFTGSPTVPGYATLASPIFTGSIKNNGNYYANAYSSNTTINCSLSNYFIVTVATSGTFTFNNPPASGNLYTMAIKVSSGGTAPTITWPTTVRWPNASAPTPSSNTDVWVFLTDDGGTNWRGSLAMKDSR